MLANGDAAVKAAQQLTSTIAVIFIASGDPVGDGLVQSLARPGGNLTGFAVMEPTLGVKLLGMLEQVAPQIKHVGVLVNPDNATHRRILALLSSAAGGLWRRRRQRAGSRAYRYRGRDDAVGPRL